MKIIFMGTPDFAVPALQRLIQTGHSIELVVSAPDKERGRGREVSPTPVKEFALKNGLRVVTPINLKEEAFIQQLKSIEADLFIIVAFRILPKEVFTLPKRGAFNLHGSLLPKYRGAAPIQWSLINGDKETGVTTFFLEEKVDTGNMIMQEKIAIEDGDDFGTLHDKMMILGADVILKTVEAIANGTVELQKQDDKLTSPAPKITKEICAINWNRPSEKIHNLVRGLSPFPGAFFIHNDKQYKIYKTRIITDTHGLTSNGLTVGAITQTKNEIFILTGDGWLQILELQPEGRKRMTSEEFLRGYKLA